MLIPFLHELDELRSMVEIYLSARRTTGHDPLAVRVIAMYHIYVGESSAEARTTAEPALAAYHAAAAEARNLTQGIPEPESYRTHDEHRAKMRKLTFNDLVEQNRVLVGDARGSAGQGSASARASSSDGSGRKLRARQLARRAHARDATAVYGASGPGSLSEALRTHYRAETL
jgi:alkanesulfonate monooxygenase SsuD/methylene tetrahydromethanopterin reductase-like flavin-dependent oxidoreductase (luciferase family)